MRLVLGLWVLLALSAGCTTTGSSHFGPSLEPLPEGMNEEVLEAGAVAEATLALSRIWSVASGMRQVGTRLTFSFWSERSALTLTEFSASGRDGPAGQPVDDEAFQQELADVITHFAQRHTGLVHLTLERQEARWTVSYSTSPHPRLPEAKTLPVRRAGLPMSEVLFITQGVRRLLRAVHVPPGAHARVKMEVDMVDGSSEDWRLRLFEVTRPGTSGTPRSLAPEVMDEAALVLLPFTQGLGERTICLDLRLVSFPDARLAQGWVEQAFVDRPPAPAETNAAFITEYRAMHEDIVRRWREESRAGAEWAARRGAEELAVWFIGGIIGRGLGWLGGKIAPTVLRALRRGKDAAVGWLRTTLTRLPAGKREQFERLWTKVQLEGKEALSPDERDELRSLMEGLEQLIRTPLDRETKIKLRARARQAYKAAHPEFADVLDQRGVLLPIHHRRPLEHAHLFPEEDINASTNLVMVTQQVHQRLDALWTKFRRARPQATAREVDAVSRTIDQQFQPWYHRASPPPHTPYSLKEAEEAALDQLKRLFPGLE